MKLTQRGMRRSLGQYDRLFHLSPSVCLSHTTEVLMPRKNKESYIFITKGDGHSSSLYIHSLRQYNNVNDREFYKPFIRSCFQYYFVCVSILYVCLFCMCVYFVCLFCMCVYFVCVSILCVFFMCVYFVYLFCVSIHPSPELKLESFRLQNIPPLRLVAQPRLQHPDSIFFLLIDEGRDWFMPFRRALARSEM